MAESEEELKSLLMKVKEEREKVGDCIKISQQPYHKHILQYQSQILLHHYENVPLGHMIGC